MPLGLHGGGNSGEQGGDRNLCSVNRYLLYVLEADTVLDTIYTKMEEELFLPFRSPEPRKERQLGIGQIGPGHVKCHSKGTECV